MAYRDHTKVVKIGDRLIGGGNPILIQSMTNTRTEDVKATVEQIHRLEQAGCEIIRCTVPTPEAARAVAEIKKQISIPLVADIHFDYKMAIAAMENGADKIRINPGNIGGKDRIAEVVRCARERQIPIRVGVNSGSLEKNLVEKYGGVTAEGLVESALDKVGMVEDCGYDQMVISIKSSNVMMCIRAHEILAQKTDYPLHVGITEAGTLMSGNIKSAVGLGVILYQGIGDTIRVSLTGDPVEEIKSALERSVSIANDDGLEARQIKAMVEGMKSEARAYVAAGGTIVEYGRRLTERQDAEIAAYERTKADFERAKETMRGNALINYWELQNDKLRNLGIRPLTLESLE